LFPSGQAAHGAPKTAGLPWVAAAQFSLPTVAASSRQGQPELWHWRGHWLQLAAFVAQCPLPFGPSWLAGWPGSLLAGGRAEWREVSQSPAKRQRRPSRPAGACCSASSGSGPSEPALLGEHRSCPCSGACCSASQTQPL